MKMTITEYRNFQKLEKQRLMTFTKCELVEELLAVYEHLRKLQNTSSNSDYAKCTAEVLWYIKYSKDSKAGRDIAEIIKKYFA